MNISMRETVKTINEAISNASKTQEEEMGAITSGLNLPGMF